MIEYIVVIAPLKAGDVTRMSPSPERISSTRLTRSSSSRPSEPKSLRNVERLTSLIVAPTPVIPGTVCATRSYSSSPRRAVVRPLCGRSRLVPSRLNVAKSAFSSGASKDFGTGSTRNEKPSMR
jgi:hypothetical protein